VIADDRRVLPMEKLGELLAAGPEFCLAISYNPGYQSVLKDLKQSTRQRFVALEFGYPEAHLEQRIIQQESGIGADTASALVKFARMTRNLKGQGLDEGASGVAPVTACRACIAEPLTDEAEMLAAVKELSTSLF
jgi:nitric oxide reductase NorQ protein